jgi:hypothetical protein
MSFHRLACLAALVSLCAISPSIAFGQSTCQFPPTLSIKPDGTPSEVALQSEGDSGVRFEFFAKAGRSYSMDIEGVGDLYGGSFQSFVVTGAAACPSSDGPGFLDRSFVEPTSASSSLRRVTFTTLIDTFAVARVVATLGTVAVRVTATETTLYSNWFFAAGDYSAFTLLRNTTSSSLGYRINWRDSAGTIRATRTGALAANANTAINALDVVGAAVVVGSVEILHDSAPGALVATTTVLSPTNGISFDMPFVQRR